MHQRLLYPWHLPPYGLPNTQAFAWQPKKTSAELLHLPDQVRGLVQSVKDEWMFDFSCSVARKLRQVGARLEDQAHHSGAVFIANDSRPLSLVTSAHAFLMSMAQPAAFEIAGLMSAEPAAAAPPMHSEITGVAFFAECASNRGSGRRLSQTLRLVAAEAAQRIAAAGFMPPSVWFTHSKPSQARSPIEGCGAMPVSAYRIIFSGCAPETVLQALADALQTLPRAHRVGEKTDVMVLSNLWTPAGV